MVLEAGQGPRITSFELALEEDVADHAPLAGDGVVGEKADPGQLRPRAVAVEAAEELIAAAYGQECCSGLHGFDERGALGGEIGGDERLLAVLAAADVVEVVLAGPDGLAETDRPVVQLDAAPRAPALEDGDVAAVRVDVQVLGIEVPDDELHATASSQYGRTRPCSEAIWRRASMAVYVGRTTSSPPGRVPSTPYASASARSGRSVIFAGSSPPYLKRKRQLLGARAAHDELLEGADQRLEVDVPDPRDVAPVRDLVVQRDEQAYRRAARPRACGRPRSHPQGS